MLTFVAANLGLVKSPLAPAMAAMLSVRRPTGTPALGDIALGWLVMKRDGEEIVWHNGGTGGYRSFIGYDAKTKVGVVVLSNTMTAAGVDDIGLHLLDSHIPLMTPPKEHKEVAIDPKLLDGYVGQYQLAPSFVVTITREGDKLFAQATGQPRFAIFAEGGRDFFLKVVDAQITFTTDSSGKATSLTLHQNGANMPGKRID
jgi:CubicO group peptidase (beta-lactamase class C family)